MRIADLAASSGLQESANMGDILTFKSAAAAPPGRVRRSEQAKILLFTGVQYCRIVAGETGRPKPAAGRPAKKPSPQRPPKKRA
jgi:hypothetical protein